MPDKRIFDMVIYLSVFKIKIEFLEETSTRHQKENGWKLFSYDKLREYRYA
jgi:hypothetical protein